MLEVRIPISRRPAWFNRVRLIAASIHQWYPDAIISVSMTPDSNQSPPALRNVDWRAAPDPVEWAGTRSEYLATMMHRYRPPFHGDTILMLDADVIPVRPFDELLDVDAIQGVQAHHAPYGVEGWKAIFRHLIGSEPQLAYEYSGIVPFRIPAAETLGPFYPNSGMVIGPRRHFEALSPRFFEAIDLLRANVSDTYWFDQVGFAMACVMDGGVPVQQLPLRYNFPNRPSFDAAYPDELADVRFLHAMQTDIVHRDRDFESAEAAQRLVARTDLTGSNEVLRQRVGELMA